MFDKLSDKLKSTIQGLQDRHLQSDSLNDALQGLSDEEAETVRSYLPNVVRLSDKLKSLSTGKNITPGTDHVVAVKELPPIEQHLLEASIGVPDFLPAWFLELGAKRQASVCRIRAKQNIVLPSGNVVKSGNGWGTGFMLSESLLLTNHHVIESADFAKKKVLAQFNFQVDFQGAIQPLDEYAFDPDNGFVTSDVNDLDFTLIRLKAKELGTGILQHAGQRFGFVPISTPTYAVKQLVNIIQHPDGRFKEVVLHQNQVEVVDTKVLKYTADTEFGSSGSPVFDNSWQVLALHYKAGDVVAGEPINNEGIRIDRILEAIKAQAPDIANELEAAAS
jgi:endonuclease G